MAVHGFGFEPFLGGDHKQGSRNTFTGYISYQKDQLGWGDIEEVIKISPHLFRRVHKGIEVKFIGLG